jgi:uncharacterized protein YecT (DUF1311 family)
MFEALYKKRITKKFSNEIFIALWLIVFLINSLDARSQECEKVKIIDFPEKDLPTDFNPAQVQDKKSYKYYYGIGVNIDYVKARHLAFVEMKIHGDNEDIFEGSSILLMLYANGFGVERNLDLCIRLACANVEGATAEIEGRIEHLKEIKAAHSRDTFDICDDITSGLMMGMCESIRSELAKVNRENKIDSIIKNWSQKDRRAYGQLRKVASDFFEERTGWEVDLSGTARAMFEIEESDALEDDFQKHVSNSDNCAFKKYSQQDYIKTDKLLNDLYLKIMGSKEFEWGTVTKEGIKKTQRKWIQYRDAWATFAKVKCAQVDENSLKTIITKERIEQLKGFLEE